MNRISRDQAYMEIAQVMSRRSTCLRGNVGCVAVVDNHIVCAGYNGAPTGMPECLEVGCGGGEEVAYMDPKDPMLPPMMRTEFPNGCIRAIHAEANMVAYAAKIGVSLDGCTVYATHGPCLPCAQAMIAAGTRRLVFRTPYRLSQGLALMDEAHVEIKRWEEDYVSA